jgi:hypothetical protein
MRSNLRVICSGSEEAEFRFVVRNFSGLSSAGFRFIALIKREESFRFASKPNECCTTLATIERALFSSVIHLSAIPV